MEIRTIETEDYAEIKVLIQKAFENEEHSDGDEQLLVERIRKEKSYQKEFEVIALINSEIVGHGLLSPVIIEQKESSIIEDAVMALAPLAVKKNIKARELVGLL
ncbi:GNAT family acetyltransferase [Carnobacterium maltaromaticum LMA28]|uniref:GNAT family acetyltransferase n=1 Tax=Carnobacterium maltaromaticum LMA28 TaxID=1234679 RepID=K8E7L7_CARML|nr:GNAT family acetyltransferase [Carnobacterium maltaromaticum]CCO12945.2 GNAT family acetyltransferase [Carnobacterium maltaromaticum LMA28]